MFSKKKDKKEKKPTQSVFGKNIESEEKDKKPRRMYQSDLWLDSDHEHAYTTVVEWKNFVWSPNNKTTLKVTTERATGISASRLMCQCGDQIRV